MKESDVLKSDYKYTRVILDMLQKKHWHYTDGNATYSVKNSKSIIKSYLDGTEKMFLKHIFAKTFKDHFFVPKSYIIESKADIDLLPEIAKSDGIWFIKPSSLVIGGGKGIHIVKIKKGDRFREEIKNKLDQNTSYLIQKNIEFPALVDDVKFDLRIFGIIVYTPTEFASYIIDKGCVRYAIKRYKCNSTDIKRLITNISFHKKYDEDQLNKIKHRLTDIYNSRHVAYEYFPIIKGIFKKIVKCTFENYDNKERNFGYIFIGLDVIIDSQGKVHIIEINHQPTLYDDSTSLFEAYNYKYHYGLNNEIFKHFYDIVFNAIVTNKLVNKDLGCYKITNYYQFMESAYCDRQIIYHKDDLKLYKFTTTKKDIRRLYNILHKQPDDYIGSWGAKYTIKQCCERVVQNENDDTIFCGILKTSIINNVEKHQIVGVVGLNYNKKYHIEEFNNNYFTHILVDYDNRGKGIAKKAMIGLIDYFTSIKLKKIKRVYASIYSDNAISIKLHKSLNFKLVKEIDKIVVLVYEFSY